MRVVGERERVRYTRDNPMWPTHRTVASSTTISQEVAGQEMVWEGEHRKDNHGDHFHQFPPPTCPLPSHIIMTQRYEFQHCRQNRCPHSRPLISCRNTHTHRHTVTLSHIPQTRAKFLVINLMPETCTSPGNLHQASYNDSTTLAVHVLSY